MCMHLIRIMNWIFIKVNCCSKKWRQVWRPTFFQTSNATRDPTLKWWTATMTTTTMTTSTKVASVNEWRRLHRRRQSMRVNLSPMRPRQSPRVRFGSSCLLKLAISGLVYFAFILQTLFQNKNFRRQLDSNLDCPSRRRTRWPLDHQLGPLVLFLSASDAVGLIFFKIWAILSLFLMIFQQTIHFLTT